MRALTLVTKRKLDAQRLWNKTENIGWAKWNIGAERRSMV